ncbi:iron ABC transporter substrate-binding protein [Wolinella succinogenes]|uniref:iron ABC transporter substrate-binding protein n=1 Tax=Wolinella succinogenes TaxID=844 RepID=UPI002FCC29B4
MRVWLAIWFWLLVGSLWANEIMVDMAGREVEIPLEVSKAFAASPPMMTLLYILAPEKMMGVNYSFSEQEKRFMRREVQNLPVLGGFFGGGNQANLEKIISLRPDVVFAWDLALGNMKGFEERLNAFGIPVIYLRQNTLKDSLEAVEVMGRFLHKEDRAHQLIAYGEESLSRVEKSVESLGDTPKKRVYFAQGEDGLYTECDIDAQSEVIALAGGVNVHHCPKGSGGKRERISMEKLYLYDPDVIFVRERPFFESLKSNRSWQKLRAYREGKVYLDAASPFSWLSRPPSFMRLWGVLWVHHRLYPDHLEMDEVSEVARFYRLFLGIELSEEDSRKLLKGE